MTAAPRPADSTSAADIDLEAATVRIERSVSATKRDGLFIKTTKTDRARLVSLTGQAVTSLTEHRECARLAAAVSCRTLDRVDLVFTNDPDGKRPWRPESVTRRWDRLRKQAGLGQARTSTTLDIYWAWVPARDRDAAAHLQRVLGEQPSLSS